MNETLSEENLRSQYEDSLGDAEFESEFGASWREDIENYLPSSLYDKVMVKGRNLLPYESGKQYFGFADFSEGLKKGGDSTALAITHLSEEGKAVLDCLLEFKAPFNPDQILKRIIGTLKSYGVHTVVQDRVSLGWIKGDLEKAGIEVEVSEFTKSEIYERFAVQVNRGQVELLDSSRLRSQALGLQRFLKSGGRTKIDHLANSHDDCINVAAGACNLALQDIDMEAGQVFFDEGLEGESKPTKEDENTSPWADENDETAGEVFFGESEGEGFLDHRIQYIEPIEAVEESVREEILKNGEVRVAEVVRKWGLHAAGVRGKLRKLGLKPRDKRENFWIPPKSMVPTLEGKIRMYIADRNEVNIHDMAECLRIKNDKTPRQVLKKLGFMSVGGGIYKVRRADDWPGAVK